MLALLNSWIGSPRPVLWDKVALNIIVQGVVDIWFSKHSWVLASKWPNELKKQHNHTQMQTSEANALSQARHVCLVHGQPLLHPLWLAALWACNPH